MIVRMVALLALLAGGAAPALAGRAESMRYVAAADAAFARGQPREARVQLMNATDEDPKNAVAWMYRTRVSLALGDGRDAGQVLDRAIDAGYPVSRTLHFRAHALLLVNRPADALATARADKVAAPYRGYAARMRGRALAALGQFDSASREFSAAFAIAPRDVALWVDLARFRLLTGERLGAIQAADRAVALGPKNIDALVLKGELARIQYGQTAALPWFDKALAVDRFDLDAQLEKAATLGDMGRTNEMLAITRSVQALDPANPRAFYLQAVLAARARNYRLADKLIDQVGGALDNVPGMLLLQGSVAYQLNNSAEAIDAFGRLVEAQPNNLKARRLLAAAQWRSGDFNGVQVTLGPVGGDSDADSYSLALLGRAYEAQGNRELAAGYIDRAGFQHASVTGGNAPADGDDADDQDAASQVAQIRSLLASGNVRQGLDLAVAMQRDNPGAPDAHILAGDAWRAAGRPVQAIDAYRRSANLSFTEAVALRMIATLNQLGQTGDAVRVMDLFVSQNPANIQVRLLQADLLMARRRFADAAHVLEYVRDRLGSGDVAIASNLAWCYYQTDRVSEAVDLAAEAYALAPANPRVSHNYGWILHKAGRNPRTALALLRQAAAQAPGWALARAHLVEAEAVHGSQSIG